MLSLPTVESAASHRRLPPWLKKPLPRGNCNNFTDHLLRELRLQPFDFLAHGLCRTTITVTSSRLRAEPRYNTAAITAGC